MENKQIEKIQNDILKKDTDIKLKGLKIDMTRIVSYLTLFTVLILVVVFSLIPVGFDWKQAFTDGTWWGNFAILACLAIFGMLYGDIEGATYLKNRILGAFQAARTAFKKTVNKILELKIRGLYAEWLQQYNKKKRKRVYEDLMYRYQIKKEYFDVINIDEEYFYEIKNRIVGDKAGIVKIDERFYKLNLDQWNLINAIRNGKIKVPTIDNDCYFLTENDNANLDDDAIAMSAKSQKLKNKFLVFTLRLLLLLAVSALLAGFFVDKSQSFGEQAWFYLLSRILTLLSGVFTGVTSAKANNKIDIFVFKHKTDRNLEFIEDFETKRFVPENEIDKVSKEYEQQEANRIIPEINDVLMIENKDEVK